MSSQKNPLFANLLLAVAIEPDEIGRRIKRAREQRGWTQLEFAGEAHVSPSAVQRWERGQLPRVRDLIRLASVLGIPSEQLVEDTFEASSRLEASQGGALAEILQAIRPLDGEVQELRGVVHRLEERLPPPANAPADATQA